MTVVNGQPVDQAVTNAAFMSRLNDTDTVGKVGLLNADVASGANVSNSQKEHNSIASFVGKSVNSVYNDLPSWVSTDAGTPTDTIKDRAEALSDKFDDTTGHNHDGTAGNGAPISAPDLIDVPLQGYVHQGVTVASGVGSSVDVSGIMVGKVPGGSSIAEGVVTAAPENKVLLRYADGASAGDQIIDGSGNIVYGRLTYAASVWTLSFYVDIAGVETAYSFVGTTNLSWYYQQIYNPMVNIPAYSEFAAIPSDNATADVLVATTSQQGKSSLATSAQSVGSSNSAGTANAVVANADHVHQGVHSVAKNGSGALYGDVTLSPGAGISLTQAAQDIQIDGVALASTAPNSVGSANTVGVGTTSARADHVHQGVHSVAKSGDPQLYGDVELAGSGGTSLVQAGQIVTISSPALASVAPSAIASTGAVGVGTTSARVDHTHEGVHSVSKSGSAQLTGDVTFTAGTGIYLNQSGSNIEIESTGGGGSGGGGSLQWIEDLDAPPSTVEYSQRLYLFSDGLVQELHALVKVPAGYNAGSQIKMRLCAYASASTNTIKMQSVAILVRSGIDTISSTTNFRVSTNIAVANIVNTPQIMELDLTDASGQINSVAVSPNDLIKVRIERGTCTNTNDIKVPVYGAEVTFNG